MYKTEYKSTKIEFNKQSLRALAWQSVNRKLKIK